MAQQEKHGEDMIAKFFKTPWIGNSILDAILKILTIYFILNIIIFLLPLFLLFFRGIVANGLELNLIIFLIAFFAAALGVMVSW